MSWKVGVGVVVATLAVAAAWTSVGRPQVATPGPAKPRVLVRPVPDPPSTKSDPIVRWIDVENAGETLTLPESGRLSYGLRALSAGRYEAEIAQSNPPYRNTFFVGSTELNPAFPYGDERCTRRAAAVARVLLGGPTKEIAEAAYDLRTAPPEESCPKFEGGFRGLIGEVSPIIARLSPPRPETPDEMRLVLRKIEKDVEVKRWEWPVRKPARDTEQDRLVNATVARLARFASLATETIRPVLTDPAKDVYTIEGLPGDGGPVVLTPRPWVPATYAAVAKRLMPRSTKGEAPLPDTLSLLLEPRIAVLLKHDADLAPALAIEPANAALHERAALTELALALRMPASLGFYDARGLLNDATAHLAAAEAVNAASSIEREFALASLDILAGRTVAGVRRLGAAKTMMKSPAHAAWDRSLRMRASGDWRHFEKSSKPSLFEQLEYAGALARVWTPDRAIAAWRHLGQASDLSLWCRVLLDPKNPIEVGGELGQPCVDAEAADAVAIQTARPLPSTSDWWTAPVAVEDAPVGVTQWRRFAESSLVDPVWRYDAHLGGLASDEVRLRFRRSIAARLAMVPLMNFLRTGWSTGDGPALSAFAGLPCEDIRKRLMQDRLSVSVVALFMGDACGNYFRPANFLKPVLPVGTTFDYQSRLQHSELLQELHEEKWDAGPSQVFFTPNLFQTWVVSLRKRPPQAADFASFSGEVAYNVRLSGDWARVLADLGRFEEAVAPAKTACEAEASDCFGLSQVYRALGRREEAFRAAQRGQTEAGGTVYAATEAGWLVDQFLERGRIDDAAKLVEAIEQTGAAAAMQSAARLSERLGDFPGARKRFEEYAEAYGGTDAVCYALRRRVAEGKAKGADIENVLGEMSDPPSGIPGLPAGARPWVDPKRTVGVFPSDTYEPGAARKRHFETLGFRPDDVVTHVNGHRVRNVDQFFCAMSLGDPDVVSFTVSPDQDPKTSRTLSGPFERMRYGLVKKPSRK